MYIEGDIFKIENVEYKLRHINRFLQCWLEPVIMRHGDTIVTGGLNITCHFRMLSEFEYVERSKEKLAEQDSV